MSNNDNYYRQRVEEEVAAAKHANDPSVAQIHSQLAERYQQLIKDDGFLFEKPAAGRA